MVVDNTGNVKKPDKRADISTRSFALLEYLPFSPRGAIIVTTQDRKAASKYTGFNVINVGIMVDRESRELFRKALQKPTTIRR
jgi:hypothetical protein